MPTDEALGPFDHEGAARGSGREPWTWSPPPGCTKIVVTNLAGVGVGSPAYVRLDGVPASVGCGSLPVLPETSRLLVVSGPVSIVGGQVDLHPIVEARRGDPGVRATAAATPARRYRRSVP
jgi:hypothetical protein